MCCLPHNITVLKERTNIVVEFFYVYFFLHLNISCVIFAGPKQNTVQDFWLMIWQEDVKQVVMLTNLMEGTKVITYSLHQENPFQFDLNVF